jgi:predicted phage terminase large subunit-like protein
MTPKLKRLINRDREIVRIGGLHAFALLSWNITEGWNLVNNWHIKTMCRYLELFDRGTIDRLLINLPPGFGKSTLTNVSYIAWSWIARPWFRFMCSSHSDSLVDRDARKCRQLIQSEWYQERWGPSSGFKGPGTTITTDRFESSTAIRTYWTNHKGLRFANTIGSSQTGWHAHRQICDDPHKPLDIIRDEAVAATRVREWWSGTMASRSLVGQSFGRMVIMQRLEDYDLSEECIERGYTHICLPMRYRSDHPYIMSREDDPRSEGELFCPALKDENKVKQEGIELGPHGRSAQHDQLPSSRGGMVFRRDWFVKFWKELPAEIIKLQSWDHSFGTVGQTSSNVAGHVLGRSQANYYLIDRFCDKIEFPTMQTELTLMTAKHPDCVEKLIENKAAGVPLVQSMRHEIHGLVEEKVSSSTGGKLARAQSITGIIEAGNFYLPHPTQARINGRPHPCPWVYDFIESVCKFKGLKGDVADDVDAMSQGLRKLRDLPFFDLADAMTNIQRNR